MRVADASILVKFLAREEGWEDLEHLFLEGLRTPDLALKEVASALLRKHSRGEISREDLLELIERVQRLVEVVEERRYLGRALEIALDEKITIYDAIYISCAEIDGLELVTADREQGGVAKKLGIDVLLID